MRASETNVASGIPRRTLTGPGSAAAIDAGLSGHGSTARVRGETNGPDTQTRGAADRRLSHAFRQNACGFYRAAVACQGRFPEHSLYSLAIAIELSLKAFLLHRGVRDDWNRIHIRHDLRKALACAEGAGFRRAPGGVADLAASLTPFYERRAVWQGALQVIFPPDVPQACDTVGDLLCGVTGQIDEEIANDVWTAQLCRKGAHA